MILDLLVGITASLIASLIVGLFSNNLFKGTQQKVIYKIYSLFLAFATFITVMTFAYLINPNILERIFKMTDANVFTIYKYGSTSFQWIFISVVTITLAVIIIDAMQNTSKDTVKALNKAIDKEKERLK